MTGTFQGVGTLQFTPDNKRCFAYGGTLSAITGSLTTYLEFTTASEYIQGELQLNSALRILSSEVKQSFGQISFNDEIIALITTGNEADDAAFFSQCKLIIPPFTKVTIKLASDVNQSDTLQTATFTGNVYGAIEQFDLRLKDE
tara:strand:+ start:541 stop:972 length:432 start_codon:yes stop_codon:yes gene_type:complete